MGNGESENSKPPITSSTFDEAHATLLGFEKEYRRDHWVAWWMALLGPLVITATILGIVYLVQGPEYVVSYVVGGATAFVFLGRFIILLGANEPDPESWAFLKYLDARNLFVMLTYMDVMVAIFVAFHMGIVFKLPFIGQKIADMVTDGQFILRKQPWIRRAAFVGLIGFVIFPTSTTGSVGGSIFGRLLGMKRWRVVCAILFGSLLGNGLMLLFAKQISKYELSDSLMLKGCGVLAMLFALFIFERKFRSLKEFYLEEEKAERENLASAQDSLTNVKPERDAESSKTTNP